MKYENLKSEPDRVNDFWSWFTDFAPSIAGDVKNQMLRQTLDEQIRKLDPEISWEVGPGITKAWQLVLSPNLNRHLQEKTRKIVSAAPEIADWEFHPARQGKKWNYQLQLMSPSGNVIHLDASRWKYVLLQYPNGDHEIVLCGLGLGKLGKQERWQAAAIALESILGEDVMLDRINDFELVDTLESQLRGKEKPIAELTASVLGRPN